MPTWNRGAQETVRSSAKAGPPSRPDLKRSRKDRVSWHNLLSVYFKQNLSKLRWIDSGSTLCETGWTSWSNQLTASRDYNFPRKRLIPRLFCSEFPPWPQPELRHYLPFCPTFTQCSSLSKTQKRLSWHSLLASTPPVKFLKHLLPFLTSRVILR